MQIIIFPLIFLAGVFFPVNAVPIWVEVISKLNPLTYGVDAIRQIFLGEAVAGGALGVTIFGHTMSVIEEVAVVGLIAIVLLTAATWAFSRPE
jgi:ABC-2 type transport system permease protein